MVRTNARGGRRVFPQPIPSFPLKRIGGSLRDRSKRAIRKLGRSSRTGFLRVKFQSVCGWHLITRSLTVYRFTFNDVNSSEISYPRRSGRVWTVAPFAFVNEGVPLNPAPAMSPQDNLFVSPKAIITRRLTGPRTEFEPSRSAQRRRQYFDPFAGLESWLRQTGWDLVEARLKQTARSRVFEKSAQAHFGTIGRSYKRQ
jgi:hypothetical protein